VGSRISLASSNVRRKFNNMCLAIPGRIISVNDTADPLKKSGRVDFSGIVKEVSLAYVPDAVVGDYVIVHVGFALQKVDEQEALEVFEYLRQIGELAELETA
jgi:hydrogenase expression/formation protein HypC